MRNTTVEKKSNCLAVIRDGEWGSGGWGSGLATPT